MDYKQFKLNDISELVQLYNAEPERFGLFLSKVYAVLDRIKVGQTVFIRDIVKEKNIEVFVKVACFYMDDYRSFSGPEDSYLVFLDDYSGLLRKPGFIAPVHDSQYRSFYEKG